MFQTSFFSMKGASWAASNRRLAFKVPTLESQKLRGVWQWCSGSCNSKSLSDKVAIILETKEVDKSPHQNQFAFSLGAHPRVILVLGCFRHVALWPLSVQWTKWPNSDRTTLATALALNAEPQIWINEGSASYGPVPGHWCRAERLGRSSWGLPQSHMWNDVLRCVAHFVHCYILLHSDIIWYQ